MLKFSFGNESGSVLLLVPVLLMVLGLFMVSTIKTAETKDFYAEVRTEEKMERIQKALAVHANRYYRVPCPADPAEDPADASFGTERADCTTVAEQNGIVPFRELGLTEFDVRDIWGNYFTYAASPSFTKSPIVEGRIPVSHYVDNTGPADPLRVPLSANSRDTEINPPEYITNGASTPAEVSVVNQKIASTFVHEYCRQNDRWLEPSTDWHRDNAGDTHILKTDVLNGTHFTRSFNKNNFKAQFCCASILKEPGTEPTSKTVYFEDYIALLRGASPFTTSGLKYFTPNPVGLPEDSYDVDDLTFSASARILDRDKRVKGVNRLNYSDRQHGLKGGMTGSYSTKYSDVDGDGVATDIVSKTTKQTIYVDVSTDVDNDGDADGIPGAIFELSDLEGEESTDHFIYTLVLKDIATDHVVGSFTGEYELLSSVVGGVGKFPVNVHDFEDEIIAAGYDPASVLITQIQMHVAHVSTQIVSLEMFAPGTDPTANNTDLIVQDENEDSFLPPRSLAGYRPADEGVIGSITSGLEAPAYTLVSHGANGAGAYIVGTTNRVTGAGVKEQQNADDDRTFTSQRRVLSNNNDEHFDDIVLWDSQMSLYNALPNATCETAQAEVN